MEENQVSSNITKVLAQVRAAAEKHGRDPADVAVMAVSKTQPVAAVRAAAKSGMRDFGENYLQDALPKIDATRDLDLTWHFIGPIQSNKTRAIAGSFDWVHSVDRGKILRRLDERDPGVSCPVIVVTGDGEWRHTHPRLSAVLSKPFNLDDLRQAVSSALERP